MTTHIGKIARLPHAIREQLNHRLQNGEIGRRLLNWLNNLPGVQTILAELFNAKPITKQNLSEWRHRGYQEWLRHQDRQNNIQRTVEQGSDLEKHENSEELYEAFSRILIAEWSETLESLHTVRNPNERIERLQKVSREFARLQNGYNWSRHVTLEWIKNNTQFEEEESDTDQPTIEAHATEPPILTIEATKSNEQPRFQASPALSGAGTEADQSEIPTPEIDPKKAEHAPNPVERATPQTENEPQETETTPANNMIWSAIETTPPPPDPTRQPSILEPAPIKPKARSLHPIPIRAQRWRAVEG